MTDTKKTFTLYNYRASVVGVYDGDSVTLDIDLGLGIWSKGQKCRLLGIDTPEIRGEERIEGLKSKQRLCELILGKQVAVETYRDRTGKYGRWLVTIWDLDDELGWVNINELLLSEGYAKIYGQ
jgi:micrococcal nuclease